MDPLVPAPARLVDHRDEGGGVRTLVFDWVDAEALRPGQNFKVSVFGLGETDAVVSEIGDGKVGISIRDVDPVTHRIYLIPPGQWLGLRGPHGNGFPLDGWPEGAVGLFSMDMGLVGQRPLVNALLAQGRQVVIAHLASKRGEMVLGDALERAAEAGEGVRVTTAFLDDAGTKPLADVLRESLLTSGVVDGIRAAVVAGPRAFEREVVARLERSNIRDRDIHVLVNRNYTTGAGWSNQDLLGGVNIWQAGPVFTLDSLRDLPLDAL